MEGHTPQLPLYIDPDSNCGPVNKIHPIVTHPSLAPSVDGVQLLGVVEGGGRAFSPTCLCNALPWDVQFSSPLHTDKRRSDLYIPSAGADT